MNDTVISTVQRSKDRKKIIFRACFPFSTQNHFQNDQIFESFGVNYQQGTEEWQKYFKFKFQEMYFLWKVFSWKTFLSNKVISEGTEDRWYKGKLIFWRKHFFHWFFSFKIFEWFDMIHQWVYTRMMIKKKKNQKKLHKRYFFKEEIRILLLSVGVQSANSKKRKTFFRVVF